MPMRRRDVFSGVCLVLVIIGLTAHAFAGHHGLGKRERGSAVRLGPDQARDMHFGTFLTPVEEGRWLACGAPTEGVNAGRVYVLDLRKGGLR